MSNIPKKIPMDLRQVMGMSNAKARWRNHISKLGCVVGSKHGGCGGEVALHHIATGSSVRDDWALVPLCHEHHQGKSGIHGMGSRNFLRLYRPPGETEWGLIVWMIEQLAKS